MMMEYATHMNTPPITGRQLFEDAGLRSHWITENHGSPLVMWKECQSLAALTVVALRYGAPQALVALALSECADIISDGDTACHAALTQEIQRWISSDGEVAVDVSAEQPEKNCCIAMSGLMIMVQHMDHDCSAFTHAMVATLVALGENPKHAIAFRRLVPISSFSVPQFVGLTDEYPAITLVS